MAHASGRSISLVVITLGVLVAALPFVFLPHSSGPVAFAIRLMQAIAAAVGLGVAGAGFYSYRTGNLRPAMVAGLTVSGLVLVGTVGAIVETSGGPLVPIWVWFGAAVLVVALAVLTTQRLVDGTHQQHTG